MVSAMKIFARVARVARAARVSDLAIKCPETMQIEKSITSNEPRNISSTMFGVKKYHEHNSFSFLWIQKYHFSQYSDPKTSDLPPRMCMCCVPPPWALDQNTKSPINELV